MNRAPALRTTCYLLALLLSFTSLFAKKLGLQSAEQFLLYRYFHVSRHMAFYSGISLLLLGGFSDVFYRGLDKSLAYCNINLSLLVKKILGWLLHLKHSSCILVIESLAETRTIIEQREPSKLWLRLLVMPLLNIISLVFLGVIVFSNNKARLFAGMDGAYVLTIAKQQALWMPSLTGFTNNFFQSTSNIWFPINTRLIPGYFVSSFVNGGTIDPVVSYIVFSIELFCGAYFLALALRQPTWAAATAGWALVMLAMPCAGLPAIYPIYGLIPHLATFLALTSLFLILFLHAGTGNRWNDVATITALFLIFLYLVLSQPIFIVLFVLIVGIFSLFFTLFSESKQERDRKILIGIFFCGLSVLAGIPQFLLGLFKYTAPVFFAHELVNGRQSFYFLSIAFQYENAGISGCLLAGIGICGAVGITFLSKSRTRVTAYAVLCCCSIFAALGVADIYFDFWRGPSPLYFELLLWPFYVIYSLLLFRVLLIFVITACKTCIRRILNRSLCLPVIRSFISVSLVAVIPWFAPDAAGAYEVAGQRDFLYPPLETPILRFLLQQASISPGNTFRGRIATFTSLNISGPASWSDVTTIDHQILAVTGNDYRSIGLWYYNLPTLFEYSQFITPDFYRFTRALLARPEDLQIRNVMVLRRPNIRILRMLGIRFLITDRALPVTPGLLLRMTDVGHVQQQLYLYELMDTNLGNFSPIRHVSLDKADDILARLMQADFDAANEVLVTRALPALSKARSVSISVKPTGLQIHAESAGLSALILPVQFSHCLEISEDKNRPAPELFRANLVETGVLFSGQIEVSLRYFTGPFHNASCRLQDVKDMKQLRIENS